LLNLDLSRPTGEALWEEPDFQKTTAPCTSTLT
jgi:hypothetical protein